MPLLLFLAAAPLLRQRHCPSLTDACRAPPRSRRVPHACIPEHPDSEPGDPEGIQLARELAPDSQAVQKSAREPPKRDKWNHLQGKLDEFDGFGENPWAVWNDAQREVTGEMVDLQSKTRQELEDYDPVQNVDGYRDIARDLVGSSLAVGDDGARFEKVPTSTWAQKRDRVGILTWAG
ncbi:hypothetical protein FGB62_9g16 [Gracilaria domingensis]|nr:hypothetical protein FGB62_9g16 [Gracilaria domingensis]